MIPIFSNSIKRLLGNLTRASPCYIQVRASLHWFSVPNTQRQAEILSLIGTMCDNFEHCSGQELTQRIFIIFFTKQKIKLSFLSCLPYWELRLTYSRSSQVFLLIILLVKYNFVRAKKKVLRKHAVHRSLDEISRLFTAISVGISLIKIFLSLV